MAVVHSGIAGQFADSGKKVHFSSTCTTLAACSNCSEGSCPSTLVSFLKKIVFYTLLFFNSFGGKVA